MPSSPRFMIPTQSTLIQLEARSDHLDQLQHIGKTSSPAFRRVVPNSIGSHARRLDVAKGIRRERTHAGKEPSDRGRYDDQREGCEQKRLTLYTVSQQNYVDLELFAEISRIEASLTESTLADDAVIGPSCNPTLAWCSENKAALRKIRSTPRIRSAITRVHRADSGKDTKITLGRHYLLPPTPSAPSQQRAQAIFRSVYFHCQPKRRARRARTVRVDPGADQSCNGIAGLRSRWLGIRRSLQCESMASTSIDFPSLCPADT